MAICSDDAYLHELLERRRDGAERAALSGFPRWEKIDRNRPFWAARKYAADDAALSDPSNPLQRRTVVSLQHDPHAIGVLIESTESGMAAHYLSSDQATLHEFRRTWTAVPAEPFSRTEVRVEEGAVIVTAKWNTPDPTKLLPLFFLALLGHGVMI